MSMATQWLRFAPLLTLIIIFTSITMALSIECQQRPEKINPRALRREGLIPATLYGHNGAESISLVVDHKTAITMLRSVTVKETPIEVKIPHLSWEGEAVVQEIQCHPWRRNLYHLAFFAGKK
jgi:large subunit ribosomal protein L25